MRKLFYKYKLNYVPNIYFSFMWLYFIYPSAFYKIILYTEKKYTKF